jgi:prepilin-type N-terminal cleavage/methylation domain-containing protein
MKTTRPGGRKQGGFTLVEMSVVLVLVGLLFAAVTKGQELVDQAKAKRLVNDMIVMGDQLQLFAQAKGRMPGDCDADGVIDYAADATVRGDDENADRSALYAFSSALPTIPDNGTAAALQTDGCALSGGAADDAWSTVLTDDTNANVWLNDLKLAGLVSDSAANRSLAKTINEDFMFVGNIIDAGGEFAEDAAYNAIVLHNVPQSMAMRMAVAINGQDAMANRSRLRSLGRLNIDGTYENTWQVVGADPNAMRDAMVTVAYFFDRIPESQAAPAPSAPAPDPD